MTVPHITTVTLSPGHQRLARDIRAIHAHIEAALGRDRPHGAPRTLWALPVRDLLIVQAWRPMDPDQWEGCRLRHATAPTLWREGQQVRLSLIGNPVRRRSIKQGGRRVKIVHETLPPGEHADWLQDRIPSVTLDTVEVEQLGSRAGRKPGRVVTVTKAGFHASGTVADPDGLADAIRSGVGRARAYGCGLLLVGAA